MLQIGAVIEAALLEGRLFQKRSRAGNQISDNIEETDFLEESTIEDASDAALIASSVLSTYLADTLYKVCIQTWDINQDLCIALDYSSRKTGVPMRGVHIIWPLPSLLGSLNSSY